eukprot:9987738-Heterocapsa_arctica.AAC.1
MIGQKLFEATYNHHPESAYEIVNQMLHMDNQELLRLLESGDQLKTVAGEIYRKTPLTPTPPKRPPPRGNTATQPVPLPYHMCMKCSSPVGHRDRTGRIHKHCCSECRELGEHSTRCTNFQDEVRLYKDRIREYENNTAAWERLRQNDEVAYKAAYRVYEEELKKHLTRIAALKLTTPTEHTVNATQEPPQP